MQALSENDILKLQKRLGGQRSAEVFFKALSKDEHFKAAWEEPVGKQIMSVAIEEMVSLTELILHGKDEQEHRSELKAYRKILSNWSARIQTADHNKARLTKAMGE